VPVHNEYEENAWAMAEGKRLFVQFNCNGCHGNGGGGMGPALMDHKWIYGSNPEQVFSTIMEGRPNGMPSFKGKIPDQQAWQIAAYVRSMSGLVPFTAAPGRSDDLDPVIDPENSREDAADPKQSFVPAAAEMPL
jgi:cytochrome c oxidase cbb3-type subunit 3